MVAPTPSPIIYPNEVTFPTAVRPNLVVRAGRGGPSVRAKPTTSAPSLAQLYYDTYLPVFGTYDDPNGVAWFAVRLWGVLPGWIRSDQTVTGDPPTPTPRPTSTSDSGGAPSSTWSVTPSGIFKLSATGVTNDLVNARDSASIDGNVLTVLAADTTVQVRAWQTDDQGEAWYEIALGSGTAWVWSGGVNLTSPQPTKAMAEDVALWRWVSGKGMWLPAPLLKTADPKAIVSAAHKLGLSHIYVEAGSSGRGFYGRQEIDRLLPAAHRDGIKVIGWVMTSLYDLPRDVSLCERIADYQTPSGDHLDGIAPDIEQNMDGTDVGAFAQILRAQLGSDHLIVGVIYPAGSWIGQQHPIAGILGRSVNVLAPMDYWHDQQGSVSTATVADYVRQSVVDIKEATGNPSFPVAVVGQTYDSFGRDGTGPNNPSSAEINAALRAAQDAGAIGISFFQWGTATPSEWTAIGAFRWVMRPGR